MWLWELTLATESLEADSHTLMKLRLLYDTRAVEEWLHAERMLRLMGSQSDTLHRLTGFSGTQSILAGVREQGEITSFEQRIVFEKHGVFCRTNNTSIVGTCILLQFPRVARREQ
jgi:hypothetical protein